jgi:hypothetical protein
MKHLPVFQCQLFWESFFCPIYFNGRRQNEKITPFVLVLVFFGVALFAISGSKSGGGSGRSGNRIIPHTVTRNDTRGGVSVVRVEETSTGVDIIYRTHGTKLRHV